MKEYRQFVNVLETEFQSFLEEPIEGWRETALKYVDGFAADELFLAGEFNPYNGVTDEMCKVYLARHLNPASIERDETEEFEYAYLLPEEFDTHVQSGRIWDGMTLAAWALVKHLVTP